MSVINSMIASARGVEATKLTMGMIHDIRISRNKVFPKDERTVI
jgi:hypothetical protein